VLALCPPPCPYAPATPDLPHTDLCPAQLDDGSLHIPGFVKEIQEGTGQMSMTLGDGSTVNATGYTAPSPASQVNKIMFVVQIS
jgi:hypothetical protein